MARARRTPTQHDELNLEVSAVPHLAAIQLLGGKWRAVGGRIRWIQTVSPHPQAALSVRQLSKHFAPRDRPWGAVTHALGTFRCEVGSLRFTLTGVIRRSGQTQLSNTVLSGLPILELLALEERLADAMPPLRVRVWGGPIRTVELPEVVEQDVVLPSAARRDLFPWLDRFWQLADRAKGEGLAPRRGLLLVGPPGTGKTQFLRHLATRYPVPQVHLFIPHRREAMEDPFGSLITSLQRPGPGAIVMLEDLDRMLESGALTREYLLNCLDGMLQLRQPALWVATANDPHLFDPAILERPGRFDRIVRFEVPDAEARVQLLRNFLGSRADECQLDAAAAASDGLTGAALRAASEGALLAELDGAGSLDECLRREIAVVSANVGVGADIGAGGGRRGVAGFAI